MSQTHTIRKPLIRKTYFYGPGEAGVEEIYTLEEFAELHIQDDTATREIAERLARGLEDRNVDEGAEIVEVYEALDTEALREALRDF